MERPTASTARLLLGVAAEGLDMQVGDGFECAAARGVEVSQRDKMVGERLALVESPGGKGREQRRLVDQAVLKGQAGRRAGHATGRSAGT